MTEEKRIKDKVGYKMDNYIAVYIVFFTKVAFYSISWGLLRKAFYSIVSAVTDGKLEV